MTVREVGKAKGARESKKKSEQKMLKTVKNVVEEEEEEAFFQDSDDAMDWSSEEEDLDEEEEEEEDLDGDEEEEDFDEEAFVDSEADEEDEDVEFVEDDSEGDAVEDSEYSEDEDDDDLEEDNEDDDSTSESESKTRAASLKEKDLLVPSVVAPASNPLLKFFWKLSDSDKTVRLAAVSDLIGHIQISQSAFVPAAESTDHGHNEKVLSLYDSGALKTTCCADLTYTVKRLIKGLASGRDEARFGFMLALLAVYQAFSVQLAPHAEVLLFWSFKLNTAEAMGGSLKKREERLLLVARLFALGALFRTPALLSNLSEASLLRGIDSAVALAKKKSFLRESALEVLISLFTCGGDALPRGLAAYAFRKLGTQAVMMCEALAFAISVDGSLSDDLSIEASTLPMPQFIHEFKNLDCLLCPENAAPIMDILAEVPGHEGRLHLLWKLVAKHVTFSSTPFMSKAAFMSTVIEGILLNNSSTAISKRWSGFLVIRELIELDALEWMPIVFTPASVRVIRGALGLLGPRGADAPAPGKEVALFNRAVKSFMNKLIEQARSEQADSRMAVVLITTIGRIPSGSPGKSLLEACSDDATITDKLYAQLTLENVTGIVAQLRAQITVDPLLSAGAFVAQFEKLVGLLKVERLHKITGADEWIERVLDVFISFLASGALPREHAEALTNKLMVVLTELQDSRRSAGWLERAGDLVEAAFSSSTTGLDAPTKDALRHLAACKSVSASLMPQRLARAHSQLCSYLKLLVFFDPLAAIPCCTELSAVSVLEENKKKKGKKGSSSPAQPDSAALVQVILDTLLTFISKPSQFTRRMGDEVFKSLVPVIQSASQLEALFAILKSGRVEDFMDVEEVEEADDDDDFEDEIEDESGLAEIDAAMAASARSAAANESSSDEADLDDSQMEAFDEKLAEIFREKKRLAETSGNSGKRYAREKRSLTEVKGKVLEMLAIAFRSGDLALNVRLQAMEALLGCVAVNARLAATFTAKKKTKAFNASSASAAQEQAKLCERIEAFVTETLSRSVRPAGEEDAKLATSLALQLLKALAEGTLLAGEEVGVSVLMRAASCVWFCVKVVRSHKATAEANETAMKAAFSQFVSLALSSSATEEANWRVLRGFVMTWAEFDLSFVLPALASHAAALIFLIEKPASLRPFQRRQLLEMLASAFKRAASFGVKEAALTLLAALPAAFASIYLEAEQTGLKVDLMRDDLKFIQMAAKKHAELDPQAGKAAWETILKNVPRAMEARLQASKEAPTAAIKSFLGHLKSC